MDGSAKLISTGESTSQKEHKKIFPRSFHDSNFINEYGKLEGLRADRYGLGFSIILIHIEPIDSNREYLELLKNLSNLCLEVLRDCDVVGMVEERRVLIILPETDYFGSLITIRKLSRALKELSGEGRVPGVIFSQASFPRDARDFAGLLNVASERIVDRKESLWERLKLDGKIFWEIMGVLLGRHHRGLEYSTFDLGCDHELKVSFIERMNTAVVREITRNPGNKGILYLSQRTVTQEMPVIKALNSADGTATKVFIVTEKKIDGSTCLKNATLISLDDPRVNDKFFTFFLSEGSAYAFVCKESWSETFFCFHTSDKYLVEGLIQKFQMDFSLQEQLG